MAIEDIGVKDVWVAYFGVRTLRCVRTGMEILVGNFCDEADVTAVSARHVVYSVGGGRGDAGGAILDTHGNLIGLQLGAWDVMKPPPSRAATQEPCTSTVPEPARAAEATADGLAASGEQWDRVVRMGLAEVGSEVREWVVAMASKLYAGGYGIFLGDPAIRALLAAAELSEVS